jgi:hypothetical protein
MYGLDDCLRLLQILPPDAITHELDLGKTMPLVNVNVSDVVRVMTKWSGEAFKAALETLGGINAYEAWRNADDTMFATAQSNILKCMADVPPEIRKALPDKVVQLIMWIAANEDKAEASMRWNPKPTPASTIINRSRVQAGPEPFIDVTFIVGELNCNYPFAPAIPKSPSTWSNGGAEGKSMKVARMRTDPLVINLAPFASRMREYMKMVDTFRLLGKIKLADGFVPTQFCVYRSCNPKEVRVSSTRLFYGSYNARDTDFVSLKLISSDDGSISALVADVDCKTTDPYKFEAYMRTMDGIAKTMDRLADPAEWDISNAESLLVKMMMVSRKCVSCGRALKDARSVEAGMGPVCSKRWNDTMSMYRLPENWQQQLQQLQQVPAMTAKQCFVEMLGMSHLRASSPLVIELEQILSEENEENVDALDALDALIILQLRKVFPDRWTQDMVMQAVRDLPICIKLGWKWTPPSMQRHEGVLRLALHTTTNPVHLARSVPLTQAMREDKQVWFFHAFHPVSERRVRRKVA